MAKQLLLDCGYVLNRCCYWLRLHVLAAYKFAKKENNIGIMATGIIGGIMALVFIVLLLVPIPMFNCSLGKESYISLIAWIALGAIFYITARRIKKD